MEIRLKCNDSLELNNFNNLKTILLDVLSYNLIGNTLKGDVMIDGEYFIKNEDNPRGFEDIVPFTMVFRDNNLEIENVSIDNFNYDITEENIIKLYFEIVVIYSIVKKDNENNLEEEVIEVPVEIDQVEEASKKIIDEENYAYLNDNNITNNINNIITDTNDLENQITKKYDELLDEIMSVRETKTKDNNLVVNKQKTTYKSITVFYLNKESEIENISKERRISIQEIYKNNDDFINTKRIIINE